MRSVIIIKTVLLLTIASPRLQMCTIFHRPLLSCEKGKAAKKLIFKSSNGRDVDVRANALFSLTFSKMPAVNSRRLHLTLFTAALPTWIYFSLFSLLPSSLCTGIRSSLVSVHKSMQLSKPTDFHSHKSRAYSQSVCQLTANIEVTWTPSHREIWLALQLFQLVCKVDKQIIAQLRKQLITALRFHSDWLTIAYKSSSDESRFLHSSICTGCVVTCAHLD